MSSYTQILYQIVFGSYKHLPFMSNINENQLFAYIAGILKHKNCHSYIVGGASNHIHIITHLHPAVCLSNLVKDIKLGCQSREELIQLLEEHSVEYNEDFLFD